MSEHVHGQMDISGQQKTFAGFISWMTYGAVAVAAVLIFLAIVAA